MESASTVQDQPVDVAQDHREAWAPGDLKFEKDELVYFVEDDRATGSKIGRLLALIFAVLVILMGYVAWWSNTHQSVSQDPFNVPGQAKTVGGH